MKMSCISNIVCSVLAFCVSQIAMLPISKLCYLTDITTGPSRVITSGECGTKCGTKAGCLTFITCDLAYSKTCTIYKISSKETCGQEGVLCSYFVQKIVPSDSDEILQSVQSESLIASPITKTTTTILKTITTTSITTYPVTSSRTDERTETTSQEPTTDASENITTATSELPLEKTTGATILAQTLGLSSPSSLQNDFTTSDVSNTTPIAQSSTNVESTTAEKSSTTNGCPGHIPDELCQRT